MKIQSSPSIRRMPTYLHRLFNLRASGQEWVSSAELAEYMNIPHIMVRKDIAVAGLSEYENARDLHQVGMYRYQTNITKPGCAIREFYDSLKLSEYEDTKGKALHIMECLNDSFQYGQGYTYMDTTAEQALAGGIGVCQDYAHIMLSLCRMEKIPCRYVAGMMLGEGSSHAWVEVWDQKKWIGFDPTNRKLVEDGYIKISNGRDTADCLVNQGIFTGNVTQTQEISVLVEEVFDGTD